MEHTWNFLRLLNFAKEVSLLLNISRAVEGRFFPTGRIPTSGAPQVEQRGLVERSVQEEQ